MVCFHYVMNLNGSTHINNTGTLSLSSVVGKAEQSLNHITETSYPKPTIKTFILNYNYREPSTKDLTLFLSILKGLWSEIYLDVCLWSGIYQGYI